MAFLAAPLGPPSFSGCPPTGGALHPWGKEWTSLGTRRLMLSVNASCWWAGSQVNICSLAVDSGLWSQVYLSSRPPGQIWQGKEGGADLTGGCLTSPAHPTNTNTSSCEGSVNSWCGIRTRTPAQLLSTPPSLCDTAAKVCSLKNKGIWGRSFYSKVPAQPHRLSS